MRRVSKQLAGYAIVLAGCLMAGLLVGWSAFGVQLSNDAYDFWLRLTPPQAVAQASAILAIDEETLQRLGGLRNLRGIVARGVELASEGSPAVMVIDLILADPGDPEQDAHLERALARAGPLVLSSELIPAGWEDPLPRFRRHAAAVGHVHADPDPYDNVTRQIPLEKASGKDRRWALALEAYRLWCRCGDIVETPTHLQVGHRTIPAPQNESRPFAIRYLRRPAGAELSIPSLSVWQLIQDPLLARRFQDKAVFVGVTAQSAVADRHMTPYSAGMPMPGVEIHAAAFEALVRGDVLRRVPDTLTLALCVWWALVAGLTFWFLSGWRAYGLGIAILVGAQVLPWLLLRNGWVLEFAPVSSTAWLSLAGAATYHYFVIRRRLLQAEAERRRYQQAIHFVTHEMRSPLTAIQGSSELMGRYNLGEERSRKLAQMIHAESKRLARLVQAFLDVERLSAGQMQLRREPVDVAALARTCEERVRPLAERKQIEVQVLPGEPLAVIGDAELLEFALYNLMNNAVKYSPAGTRVEVTFERAGQMGRISVRDQGIGMDEEELKHIFKKFYRSKRAEASGEKGTGIGLAIVEQIVSAHGGRVEVTSKPGQGSCFTLVLPALVSSEVKIRSEV